MSERDEVFVAAKVIAPWWEMVLARLLGKRISLWPGNLMYKWRGKTYIVKNGSPPWDEP